KLVATICHLLDGVALVRYGLDIVPVAVFQLLQDIVKRIIEPRIALGHEYTSRLHDRRFRRRHVIRCEGLDAHLDRPTMCRECLASLLKPAGAKGENLLSVANADIDRRLRCSVERHMFPPSLTIARCTSQASAPNRLDRDLPRMCVGRTFWRGPPSP